MVRQVVRACVTFIASWSITVCCSERQAGVMVRLGDGGGQVRWCDQVRSDCNTLGNIPSNCPEIKCFQVTGAKQSSSGLPATANDPIVDNDV